MSNMSDNYSSSSPMNQITYAGSSVIAIPLSVRFWLYFISNCASIIVSLFVLYCLLFKYSLRSAPCNHVFIIILIVNLITEITDIPWLLYRMHFQYVLLPMPFFCQLWQFIDSVSYTGTAKLVAWASIERHILIFNQHWMVTTRLRILFHYLPIIILSTYHVLLYLVIYFIVPCDNVFDYTKNYCGYDSCAYDTSYGIYELFSNGILSSVCIAFFSIALIVRVVYKRQRAHQSVAWRKHRKMTLQLMLIVSIFYFLYLPLVFIAVVRYLTGIKNFASQYYVYGSFLSYYINFLLPFVCAGALPQVKQTVKYFLCFCTRIKITIAPSNHKDGIKPTVLGSNLPHITS